MTAVCITAELIGLLGYLLAAVLFPLRLLRPELDYTKLARRGLVASTVLQGMGLVAHTLHNPAHSLFGRYANVTFVLILLLVAALLVLERRTERPAETAFLAPVIFLLVLFTVFRPNHDLPPLHNPWFVVHILLALSAYACFGVAFTMAMAYIVQDALLKRKRMHEVLLLPPLQTADNLAHLAVAIGFPLYTLALGVGIANLVSRGAPVDAKMVTAALVWVIYAAYLLVRNLTGQRGKRVQILLVAGFVLAVGNFLGEHHGSELLNGLQSPPIAHAAE